MRGDSLVKQTVLSTVLFVVLFTALTAGMDLMQGTPASTVGLLVRAAVGGAVYAVIFYALVRRREAKAA
jgi:hypothetical protein